MKKLFLSQAAGLVMASLLTFSVQAEEAEIPSILDSETYQIFEAKMIAEHGFTADELRALFAQAEYKQSIIDAISRPAEGVLTWESYRKIFLKERRIDLGAKFWKEHADLLDRAEAQFGIDPAIIVAIIGVETRYGGNTGGYRVVDALATLGFFYPKRAKFFAGQLETFLVIARDEGFNPMDLQGSYAGAMGMPQFIPSSYRDFAIDFDGDNVRDLWGNPADVIGSVANYFAEHKWAAGDAIAQPVEVTGDKFKDALSLHGKPEYSAFELAQMGVTLPIGMSSNSRVALMEFNGANGLEYWISNNNFYVITRYNHSKLYALAVLQLAEEVRARYAAY